MKYQNRSDAGRHLAARLRTLHGTTERNRAGAAPGLATGATMEVAVRALRQLTDGRVKSDVSLSWRQRLIRNLTIRASGTARVLRRSTMRWRSYARLARRVPFEQFAAWGATKTRLTP